MSCENGTQWRNFEVTQAARNGGEACNWTDGEFNNRTCYAFTDFECDVYEGQLTNTYSASTEAYTQISAFEQLCVDARATFDEWLNAQFLSITPGAVSPSLDDNDCYGFMDRIAKWVGIYECGVNKLINVVTVNPAWCIEIQFDNVTGRSTNFVDNNINLFYKVGWL